MKGRWASPSFRSRYSQKACGTRDGRTTRSIRYSNEPSTTTNRGTAKANRRATTTKQNPQSQQEDLTQKLKKYADLKQQGVITDEEFQKLEG